MSSQPPPSPILPRTLTAKVIGIQLTYLREEREVKIVLPTPSDRIQLLALAKVNSLDALVMRVERDKRAPYVRVNHDRRLRRFLLCRLR